MFVRVREEEIKIAIKNLLNFYYYLTTANDN